MKTTINTLQKSTKITMSKLNILFFLCTSLLLASCVSVPKPQETNISHNQALQIITQNIGTKVPDRKLYHTYEETRSISDYWVSKKGRSQYSLNENKTYTLSLTKIEGNYVEGMMSYTGNGVGSYPVFGRYNFTSLYLFNSSPNTKFPELWEYQIGQNGRTLKRIRSIDRNVNGVLQPWTQEPVYGVENKKYYGKDYREITYNSTLFISKTDDYLEEEKSNTRKALQSESKANNKSNSSTSSSSLAEKLKELKELHESGVITKAEYDAMRKKALE